MALFVMNTLLTIILLAKFLIPQEFGVHALGGNVTSALLFLDSVGVSLLCVVVGARVL